MAIMKKLTITISEEALSKLDMQTIFFAASDIRMETINGAVAEVNRTYHRPVGTSCEQTIMKHYTPDGIFTRRLVERWIQEVGYSQKSASPAVSTLTKKGFMKRLDDGRIQFIKPMGMPA